MSLNFLDLVIRSGMGAGGVLFASCHVSIALNRDRGIEVTMFVAHVDSRQAYII